MARLKPLDVDTLWKLERVGNVSLSPDGSTAVCAVTSYDMEENKGRTSLWLLPTDQCAPRRLTRCGEKDGQPAFSPKGDRIAFLAKREQEGGKDDESQLYVIDAAGGEAERKTHFVPGVVAFKWMPDGQRIVFVSWVWPKLKGVRAQERAARDRAYQVLEVCALAGKAGDLAGRLSGGQQKLLELARVLMIEPKMILLDEPAAGVNPALLETLIDRVQLLNRQGITFLLIEHNMDMVMRICNPVVVMAQGRVLAQGAPQAVREDPQVIDAYLGEVAHG
jgi:ABC-type dipeptide/oligopeptide/nickel transport system ATPase component